MRRSRCPRLTGTSWRCKNRNAGSIRLAARLSRAISGRQPAAPRPKLSHSAAQSSRADQAVRGADRSEIGQRAAIAAHQQMIAVVDHPPERAIEERPAAAARLIGGLVQRDRPALAHEPHRGGEPGQPGPHHVDDRHRAQSRP
jgi:hypothetical protein